MTVRSGWLGMLVGCAGCLPEFHQQQEQNILYEHSAALHACAGNAAYLDALVPFLADQIRVQVRAPLRFSWLAGEDIPLGLDEGGGRSYRGRAVGRHAWSEEPVSEHEVAHLVTGMDSATFFVEGVAVALDPSEGLGERYVRPEQIAEFLTDPRATMSATTSSDVDYVSAGLFVTFLLTRHGPEKFRAFYTSLVWPFTMNRIAAAFRRVYGIDLDAEVEVYMQGIPPCDEGYFDLQVPECSGPTIPWEGQDWVYTEAIDCDAPGVVGGIGENGPKSTFRVVTLEVPTLAYYGLVTQGDPGLLFQFGPCFGCPWDFKDFQTTPGEIKSLALEPGKYYVRISARAERSPEATVLLTPL